MSENPLRKVFSVTKPGDSGIIGDPVEHSLSPLMQNAAFKTWWGAFRDQDEPTPEYFKFHVLQSQLKEAIQNVRAYKLRGVNVTIPHKVRACEFVDELDVFAKKVGAINTILNKNGQLKGFNTDGDGFRYSLEVDLNFDPHGKNALVMGAGGTGRVIAQKLVDLGASVFWWNRNQERLEEGLKRILNSPRPLIESTGKRSY